MIFTCALSSSTDLDVGAGDPLVNKREKRPTNFWALLHYCGRLGERNLLGFVYAAVFVGSYRPDAAPACVYITCRAQKEGTGGRETGNIYIYSRALYKHPGSCCLQG